MNVLVVGGAGYVGGGVTDLLANSDHRVRIYDGLLYEEAFRKPGDFVYGDIRDTQRLKPHLEWADAVVWLAALVGDPACALNPEVTVEINQDCVQWLSENFDGRIVFMSTCSVYGAQDKELDETSPTNPLSAYAVTKLKAEKFLEDKNAIIFRLGTLFGVGDIFSRIRLDLVVNILTVRTYQSGKVTVFGGDQFRPLLHVRDAAQAIVDTLATSHTGVYNLHKQNVRIMDLAYQIRNHFPDMRIEITDQTFQDTRNYRVSCEKAKRTFGFNPSYSIDRGIEEVKELLESRRLKDLENPRYTNQKFLSMFNTHLLRGVDVAV
jgi:nucleoside-diphosphate-sugar epimerase